MEELHAIFKDNYTRLRLGIEQVNPNIQPTLIAVSKTHSAQTIKIFHQVTAHCIFGENYAQELAAKAESTILRGLPLVWHFIGRVQSNKISKIVEHAACIHAVETLKQAHRIAVAAEGFGKTPFPVFLAANLADAAEKSGLAADEVCALADKIVQSQLPLRVLGVFSIPPPLTSAPKLAEPLPDLYRRLGSLSQKIGEGKLSLGMSHDLVFALRAGSTHIRIGTALFGERHASEKPTP